MELAARWDPLRLPVCVLAAGRRLHMVLLSPPGALSIGLLGMLSLQSTSVALPGCVPPL